MPGSPFFERIRRKTRGGFCSLLESMRSLRPLGKGRNAVEAAIEAFEVRLRPILMTSIALLLGVVPLMLATGQSQKRSSLSTQ
jgi:multidrug efflux pump subunit AcrB